MRLFIIFIAALAIAALTPPAGDCYQIPQEHYLLQTRWITNIVIDEGITGACFVTNGHNHQAVCNYLGSIDPTAQCLVSAPVISPVSVVSVYLPVVVR